MLERKFDLKQKLLFHFETKACACEDANLASTTAEFVYNLKKQSEHQLTFRFTVASTVKTSAVFFKVANCITF